MMSNASPAFPAHALDTPARPEDPLPLTGHIFGTAEVYDVDIIQDALRIGYRAFDTAGMPTYYREDLLGTALSNAMLPTMDGGLGLQRHDFHVQTKFTTPEAHDFGNTSAPPPYDAADPPETQVRKSVHASLHKLRTDYVDLFLLHGPMPSMVETHAVWRAMEELTPHPCRAIGVCNVNTAELHAVIEHARVVPAVVQNRFMAATGYDAATRALCVRYGMTYQAFWVVKANAQLMKSGVVGWLAERAGVSEVPVLFALVLGLGRHMAVVNGSKNAKRLRADWEIVREWHGAVPEAVMHAFRDELVRLVG